VTVSSSSTISEFDEVSEFTVELISSASSSETSVFSIFTGTLDLKLGVSKLINAFIQASILFQAESLISRTVTLYDVSGVKLSPKTTRTFEGSDSFTELISTGNCFKVDLF
jgi:hypothetical protein